MAESIKAYGRLVRTYGLQKATARAAERAQSDVLLQARAMIWTASHWPHFGESTLLNGIRGRRTGLHRVLAESARSARSPFLFSPNDRVRYVGVLKQRYSDCEIRTLRRAEKVLRNQFTFLGSTFDFADDVNWHDDPDSRGIWPLEYFEKLDKTLWNERRDWDCRTLWELNRHQFLCTLGKAYWITGDERYADGFSKIVLSWIKANPVGLGINWTSSLEIGIRLISWVIAFHFFSKSPRFTELALKPFLESLYAQTKFLRGHLTLPSEARNNHILGETASLAVVGSQFPQFKESIDWVSTGLETFESELTKQTFSDGVTKEQSTSYHRFVLDFVILLVLLGRNGSLERSQQLEKQLERMLDYIMYSSLPDGRSPMIGDADDGRGFLLSSSGNHWDFREWLAVGAVLCDRPDMKFVAKNFGEEAFWLLGPSGLEKFDEIDASSPRATSRSFPQAGHYVIRDDWTEESDFAFFKCGEFGLGGEGYSAHSHCDQLSLILNIKGKSVLVDSGTYSYLGPWRHLFRETRAHNTYVVDGHQQAIPRDAFRWRNVTSAECVSWTGSSVAGAMKAAHNVASRRLVRHPGSGEWELSDLFTGGGTHQISWYFHFSPTLCLSSMGSSITVSELNTASSVLTLTPPKAVHASLRHYWQSTTYGKKELGLCLVATWEGEIPSAGKEFIWGFCAL